jgi:CRISPR-associated endonuclease Cas3-HD
MVEIYVFLREWQGDVECQTLKEHVDKCIEALDEIKDTKIWRYTVKLFGEDDVVERYLKLTILLHDIGKVFYQANFCLDRERSVRYLNFRGHEYFSTYLADEYLKISSKESGNFEEYRKFKLPVLSAILYHHHAMGLKKRGIIKDVRVCRTEKEYYAMCNILNDIFRSYGLSVEGFIRYLASLRDNFEIKGNLLTLKQEFVNKVCLEASTLNGKIWDSFVGDRDFRKRMLTFVVILLIADYKGSETRTKRPPKFYNVLKEFVELYKMM